MLRSLPEQSPRRLALLAGGFALGVALIARGRLHPDEIFQYLEPAFRAVYGYGETAWEWRDGIRNWFAPGLIALVLRGLRALHVEGPRPSMAAIWGLGALWHAWGMLALYRAVERREGRGPAALALILTGSWLSYALYAPRTLADALCIPPLLWALVFTQRARDAGTFLDGLLAGLCAGLAVVLRYPELVFGVPLGLSLLLARRWRALLGMALGSALVLVALGVLDLVTWGDFLHSLVSYLRFNRPGGPVAEKFGAHPWWWYVLPLGGLLPVALLPWFVRGLRRWDVLGACWFFYLAALETSLHKESRFVLPLIPLGVAIAAGPLYARVCAWAQGQPRRELALVLTWTAMSLASPLVQWHMKILRSDLDAEDAVSADPELRALLIWKGGEFSAGGYFHLRRDVPFDQATPDASILAKLRQGTYSHVMVHDEDLDAELLQTDGYRPWLTRGDVQVWKRAQPLETAAARPRSLR